MNHKVREYQGLTFDDVLLEPRYSEVVPAEVDVSTRLTQRIRLNIPLLSSPMDTVTESEMAIALGPGGGDRHHPQEHVGRAAGRGGREGQTQRPTGSSSIRRRSRPTPRVGRAREIMDQYNVSGLPITTADGRLVGIITRRDLRFLEDWDLPISEVMTRENLVTATGTVTLEEAEKILMAKKVEKLLLVDEDFRLTGLITIKDIDMMRRFPQACKDGQGRLRAGAAVGVHDYERVEALIRKGVDVLVVDSAHGHSANVIETVRSIKKQWDIDVVAGNVATAEGCKDLIAAGADAVKVGIGPGSICTTRVISGVGVPQITAIYAGRPGRREEPDPRHRRRRNPLLRRHDQGDCRRRARGDDRRTVRRIAGKPRGTNPLPRTNVQGVSRHGLVGGHGPRLQRTLPPRRPIAGRTNWCPRASKAACPSKGRWDRSSISLSADCGRAWDIAEHEPSRSCARKRDSSRSHQPVYGRVTLMTSPLRRKRQTTARSTSPATIRRWTALRSSPAFAGGSLGRVAARPGGGRRFRRAIESAVQPASYSTGKSGSRLKWIARGEPSRPSAEADSAVTPTQYVDARRLLRTVVRRRAAPPRSCSRRPKRGASRWRRTDSRRRPRSRATSCRRRQRQEATQPTNPLLEQELSPQQHESQARAAPRRRT